MRDVAAGITIGFCVAIGMFGRLINAPSWLCAVNIGGALVLLGLVLTGRIKT